MKQPVIAIIGAGAVGATVAYSLIMHALAAKIIMVDIDEKKCEGEVKDLKDALAISSISGIMSGSLKEASQADIIIITAGIAQKPGQTRFEILKTNHEVIGSLIHDMKPFKKSSIIIVVSNPVDVLTRYVQEIAGLPQNQVFGSGTLLDTLRLRGLLAEHLSVHPQSVDAYVLGEHGDSQFVPWSLARIGGSPLASFSLNQKTLDALAVTVQNKAYDIIACKGFTAFGVATSVALYCKAITTDSKQIYPVSCFIKELGVCLSMPVVLGAQAVEQIIRPPLLAHEQEKLIQSAAILNETYVSLT